MTGSSRLAQRRGFTLVELMVVIAIIAVLMALGAGAYFKVMAAQQMARTQDAMRIIDKSLHDHWTKVVEEAKKETPSDAVVSFAGGDMSRAKVLWILLRLTEAFPQSYAEVNNVFSATPSVLNSTIYGTDPTYGTWIPAGRRKYMATYYKFISRATNGNASAESQSSACLYLALTQINRGGLKLSDEHLQANIADTDSDGLKEFVDGWGKPLQFVRFAIPPNVPAAVGTELAGLNPRPAAQQSFGDPIDPDGTLVQKVGTVLWYQVPYTATVNNGQLLTTLCQYPVQNPQPYYVPFVTSAGPDGTYGNSDDILSFRLRAGSRGD